MDPRPVEALADDPAVVVAAVPEVGDRRASLATAPRELADDIAVPVDDLDVDAVRAAKAEADRRRRRRAVAGRRERLVDDRRDDRVARQLELLGDDEGDGGRDEQAATSRVGARRALIAEAGSGVGKARNHRTAIVRTPCGGRPGRRSQPDAQAHWTGGTSEPNRSMRRRLLLSLLVVLALGAGVGFAAARDPLVAAGDARDGGDGRDGRRPDGSARDDAAADAQAARSPTPKPDVDTRCWPMFGGDARRSLARPAVELGAPKRKPLWARGLKEYIEYPPSYCDGVLYVNTFKGDTWALDSETGKVIWRRSATRPKPSTPAIAGDNVIVSAKDGTVTR